jgi:hypothetical protein
MTFCEATQSLFRDNKVKRYSWPPDKYVWVENGLLYTYNNNHEPVCFSPSVVDLKASDWINYIEI